MSCAPGTPARSFGCRLRRTPIPRPGAPGGSSHGSRADVAEDVAEVVARFGEALRGAGVSVGAQRCELFARAVLLVRAGTVRGVRECAVATLASNREQAETVGRVFDAAFGGAGAVTM